MRLLVPLSVLLLLGVASIARGDDPVSTFLENCSGCHTIGKGDLDGPDLLPSTKWPRADLRAAVQRMEANIGPMTPEQIDGLTDLLQAPDLEARLYAATKEASAARPEGSAQEGERLYFGRSKLSNGGSPCFACHTVAGQGGSLAVDLTAAHTRLGISGLFSATTNPGFPLMKAVYAKRPVTPQEAAHLAAFLGEAAGRIPAGTTPLPERPAKVHGAAGGIALVVFGLVAIVFGRSRAGVRERMVRDSRREP